MAWNNTIKAPNWSGTGAVNNLNTLNVSSIYTNYLEATNISSLNGSIAFLSNLVLKTGVIELGISPTILTAEAGVLYVNGDAVAFPSSFSTIADWSQFKAVANVDMSRSSIYNVLSISTNTISTGTLQTNVARVNGLSTVNVSSANITFDTLNGRAGVITTLSGTNQVYNTATISNVNSSNIFSRSINSSNIINSNTITTFGISSVIVSTGYIVADVGFFNSTFNSTIFSYKGIFQSTATGVLIASNISTGFIYGADGLFSNLNASNLTASNVNISSVISPDILKNISSASAVKTFGDQLVNKAKDKVISVVEGKVGEIEKRIEDITKKTVTLGINHNTKLKGLEVENKNKQPVFLNT
jgi:hypothetical protein